MNDRKKIGSVLFAGLVVLSAMVVLATPAVAQVEEEDPVLWVVPDNPTRWSDSSASDQLLQETVVEDVYMDTTFSGNVLVLHQTSPSPNDDAMEVYLKFFVHDASNIDNIIVGTAKRIEPGNPPPMDPNTNSTTSASTLIFSYVAKDEPVPAGYGVEYSIGDIPYSGGPSQTGDPEPDVDDFDPDNADYYIKVPFTINFNDTPDDGFVLYVYAENDLTGKDRARTAYSHDGAFHQIPEFATIAIPVAAILGLLFFFNHRKKRRE